MTQLPPVEMRCPECHGEGRVECCGIHPRRIGPITHLESPDYWSEWCPVCDGSGRREDDDAELS